MGELSIKDNAKEKQLYGLISIMVTVLIYFIILLFLALPYLLGPLKGAGNAIAIPLYLGLSFLYLIMWVLIILSMLIAILGLIKDIKKSLALISIIMITFSFFGALIILKTDISRGLFFWIPH